MRTCLRLPGKSSGSWSLPTAISVTGAHDEEFTEGKLSGVFVEYLVEAFDLGLQGRTWHLKKEDAGMGEALVENQLQIRVA
jgi:hypothetical protein